MARSKESIDVFKSRITRVQGFARPNLFTVFVRRPGGLQDLLPEVGSQFKSRLRQHHCLLQTSAPSKFLLMEECSMFLATEHMNPSL